MSDLFIVKAKYDTKSRNGGILHHTDICGIWVNEEAAKRQIEELSGISDLMSRAVEKEYYIERTSKVAKALGEN